MQSCAPGPPIAASLSMGACLVVAAMRCPTDEAARAGAVPTTGVLRLLDRPESILVRSPWDRARFATVPERGLAPTLVVDFESGLPVGALVLPPCDPQVVTAAAANGAGGLHLEPAAGAVCFVLPALPQTAYLAETKMRWRGPVGDRTAGLAVIEVGQSPTDAATAAAIARGVIAGDVLAVAGHHARTDAGEFAAVRLSFRTTRRTRGLVVALRAGTAGGGAIQGAVDFDDLKLWELPLVRQLAMEPPTLVQRVELHEDWRRALIALPGTRIELPIPAAPGPRRLAFAYGVLDERRSGWGTAPIRIKARLEREEGPPLKLLARELAAGSGADARTWQEFAGEVAHAGPCRLVLESECDVPTSDVLVFAEPRVETLAAPGVPRRPSVILISLDTLRADRLGCYGYRRADGRPTSARIDQFARSCVRFAAARAPASYTLPSHATIFTGLEPPVHRVTRLGRSLQPELHPLLAVEFARAGYETAAFTGGGFVAPDHGFAHGFDRYTTRDPFIEFGAGEPSPLARSGEPARRAAVRAHCAPEAIRAWIAARSGRPYFLFVHSYLVHDYTPPEALERAFRGIDPDADFEAGVIGRRRADQLGHPAVAPSADELALMRDCYDATIAAADAQVGALLDQLEALGQLESTVVALVSDHGEEHGEHGRVGHGISLYEELLRVAFLLHAPGVAAGVVDEAVDLADVAPTLREAAGLAPASTCDGASVLQRMREGSFRDRFWAELTLPGQRSGRMLRVGRFKLIECFDAILPAGDGAGAGTEGASSWELYDLETDPGKQRNLVASSTVDPAALAELPEPQRTLLRRFALERAQLAARADAFIPDAGALEQKVSDAVRARLRELGYAGE